MSTAEQRADMRQARDAAGAGYAQASAALIDAFVELQAHDVVAGSAAMAERPGTYPATPKTFLQATWPPCLRHEQFVEFLPDQADVQRRVESRVAELLKRLA